MTEWYTATMLVCIVTDSNPFTQSSPNHEELHPTDKYHMVQHTWELMAKAAKRKKKNS